MYYHKSYRSRLYLSLLPCLPRSAQVLRTACPLVRPFSPLPTLIHVEGPRQRMHPLLRGGAAGEQTCYNPPTNFSFFPSSGPPSTQPAVPLPQPISTAPAPAPVPPAPLAFNPFRTDHLPLYDVTDFYEPPQGYAQLQQPLGSPHRQPLPPSDAEMSSPTHTNSPIDHYGLLQPPSPRDDPMEGTPPSDHLPFRNIEPVDYMSYGETLQWLYNTAGVKAPSCLKVRLA